MPYLAEMTHMKKETPRRYVEKMGLSRFSSSVTVRTQAERQMLLLKNIDRHQPFHLPPVQTQEKGIDERDHNANDRHKKCKIGRGNSGGKENNSICFALRGKGEGRRWAPFFPCAPLPVFYLWYFSETISSLLHSFPRLFSQFY